MFVLEKSIMNTPTSSYLCIRNENKALDTNVCMYWAVMGYVGDNSVSIRNLQTYNNPYYSTANPQVSSTACVSLSNIF